jgi:hypothetical protein
MEKLMYIKLPINLFLIWRLDIMILMQANTFLGPLEGMGPGNLDSLGSNWLSERSKPFQGPKKSKFPGPTPFNGP